MLSACIRTEISDQSLQFNQATSSVGNKLLLLNAVRASKNYPMQFSKLGSFTGSGRISGGLTVGGPFAIKKIGSGPLAPSLKTGTIGTAVNIGSGISSLQLTDVSTEEAQTKLRSPVTDQDFKYHYLQGWDTRVVSTLMIESLQVPARLAEIYFRKYEEKCNPTSGKDSKNIRCWAYKRLKTLDSTKEECQAGEFSSLRGVGYMQFRNDPRNQCRFYAFQAFIEALGVSSGLLDFNPKFKKSDEKKSSQTATYSSDKFAIDVNVKVPKDEPKAKPKKAFVLVFRDEKLQRIYDTLGKRKDSAGHKIDLLEIVFRSPERMVRYLGELIAVQDFAGQPVRQIRVLGELVDLFRVTRKVSSNTAISVVGPEGERFSILIPDHGSDSRHRSLQTLSLAMDFVNIAISGESSPPPNTFVLAGN